MSSEESSQTALLLFQSLLVFAGITDEGGYSEHGSSHFETMTTLVQSVIQRCLEMEDVANGQATASRICFSLRLHTSYAAFQI